MGFITINARLYLMWGICAFSPHQFPHLKRKVWDLINWKAFILTSYWLKSPLSPILIQYSWSDVSYTDSYIIKWVQFKSSHKAPQVLISHMKWASVAWKCVRSSNADSSHRGQMLPMCAAHYTIVQLWRIEYEMLNHINVAVNVD